MVRIDGVIDGDGVRDGVIDGDGVMSGFLCGFTSAQVVRMLYYLPRSHVEWDVLIYLS